MITETTTIQEITLQAYEFGIYDYMFNEMNMSRDEIFNLFADWGVEFTYRYRNHDWNGDYYDLIDDFLMEKRELLRKAGSWEEKPDTHIRKVNGLTIVIY